MYIKRAIEPVILKILDQFPVILLTGPRQVGKTTVLKELLGDDYQYVTLDDFTERQSLQNDPRLFFANHSGPIILDEIQYVPESFSFIKLLADQQQKAGQFVLTGSQAFQLMQNVSESLAGRIAILEMKGLSLREKHNVSITDPFIPTKEYIDTREKEIKDYPDIWSTIHRGDMPRLKSHPEIDWEIYYSSYVKTYIERDVRQIVNIDNESLFMQFMTSVASRSGELLNYQSIAKDIGVSIETVKRWISILETSGIIYLLKPYANNHLKRVLKTPKLYFLDTGLLAYLTKWPTPETLASGATAGNVFETFVISEIIKSYLNAGKIDLPLYYYRDRDKKEIDLLIEYGDSLYPIEIKHTANPQIRMGNNFSILDQIANKKRENGTIICRYPRKYWLAEDLIALPIEYI